jgi:hypothetical protein
MNMKDEGGLGLAVLSVLQALISANPPHTRTHAHTHTHTCYDRNTFSEVDM